MSCFLCFKPDKKKMLSKRMDARPVKVVKTVLTQHGASLKNSESDKLPRVPSNHKQSSEAEKSAEHPKGNPVTARTGKAFTFRELATATKNFRSDCLLGEGGFGMVYKGKLDNGQLVAVKQLDLNGFQGNQEFLVEVMMLSLLHHPNLSVEITCDQQAKPMLKDRRRYHELVDPLLGGEYPERDLNEAVGVAAMCLQEEPSFRPYMSDAVVALGLLAEAPAGYVEKTSTAPQNKQAGDRSVVTGRSEQDQSRADRQRAVAEAIEWGAMRQRQRAQVHGKKAAQTAQSQGIVGPVDTNRL
ncbi:hypothetical protein ABZP36_013238 [Zizania latifolia]